jgi:hypothetical protein
LSRASAFVRIIGAVGPMNDPEPRGRNRGLLLLLLGRQFALVALLVAGLAVSLVSNRATHEPITPNAEVEFDDAGKLSRFAKVCGLGRRYPW